MERPQKEKRAVKGKTNHKKILKKLGRAVNHFLLRLRILFRPNAK